MIWIIILGLIAGYREVQILCDRGSWRYLDFRKVFWFTNQAGKWKNFDSFHASNGLYALVLCIFCTTCTNYTGKFLENWGLIGFILEIILNWVLYMYARNVMMHVILPKKPIVRYLIPLIGEWFKKKANT